MPLWKSIIPLVPTQLRIKRNSPKSHRDVLKDSNPEIYVRDDLEEVAAESFYVGGAPHGKFVRLKLDHMARTLPGPTIREWWVKAVDQS